MVQLVKCLLYKQEDLRSEPQTPSRDPGVAAHTWNFSDGADTGRSGALGQTCQNGEPWTQ